MFSVNFSQGQIGVQMQRNRFIIRYNTNHQPNRIHLIFFVFFFSLVDPRFTHIFPYYLIIIIFIPVTFYSTYKNLDRNYQLLYLVSISNSIINRKLFCFVGFLYFKLSNCMVDHRNFPCQFIVCKDHLTDEFSLSQQYSESPQGLDLSASTMVTK